MIELALIPLTALFSALHGSNRLPRLVCMALHGAALATVSLLIIPNNLPALTVVTVGILLSYWFVCRSGRVCDAEMKCMAEPTRKHFLQVAFAYTPYLALIGIAGILSPNWLVLAAFLSVGFTITSLKLYNYRTRRGRALLAKDANHRIKNHGKGRFIDCRRMAEIPNGIVGGVGSLSIIYAIAGFW